MLRSNYLSTSSKIFTVLIAGASVLFLVPFVSHAFGDNAVEVARLHLDEATITKGYTIESPDKDLKVGVVDRAVTVPVEVVLKKIPVSHFPADSRTSEKVSDILEYDIRHQVEGGTESLGVLEKPVYIALRYYSDASNKKIIHFWNKPEQRWVPLPTTTDFENNLVRATSYFPYSRLAVFDHPYIYEGPASWYVSGFCCGYAASPHFTRFQNLKVTNLSPYSSKFGKTVIARTNDHGPDQTLHPDRPIDLGKEVFADLAQSVGSGIMLVRVEPVDGANAEKYPWIVEQEAARRNQDYFERMKAQYYQKQEEVQELAEASESVVLGVSNEREEVVMSDAVSDPNQVVIQKSEIKFKSDF